KNPDLQGIIAAAPVMLDFLDAESAEHFAAVREFVDAAGVPYKVNPRLVRGLDYYTRTVFEWQTDALGAQGAVCSGGRYDGLVEKLGGRGTPAIGWAMGVERLVALYEVCGGKVEEKMPDVYVVAAGAGTMAAALALAETLRDAAPPIRPELNLGGGNFAAQLKRADRSGAHYAVIIGEDEVRTGRAAVKPLRSDEAQFDVPAGALVAELQKRLPGR
ncbi:MAG TPA: ATP phosphoribosyltransferase regulatory subunit, partial [Woeseiaceae bacterium]|nr:ATP phosphoribosyltransferase regulatory subunit [Woeseiaceae bacterium]